MSTSKQELMNRLMAMSKIDIIKQSTAQVKALQEKLNAAAVDIAQKDMLIAELSLAKEQNDLQRDKILNAATEEAKRILSNAAERAEQANETSRKKIANAEAEASSIIDARFKAVKTEISQLERKRDEEKSKTSTFFKNIAGEYKEFAERTESLLSSIQDMRRFADDSASAVDSEEFGVFSINDYMPKKSSLRSPFESSAQAADVIDAALAEADDTSNVILENKEIELPSDELDALDAILNEDPIKEHQKENPLPVFPEEEPKPAAPEPVVAVKPKTTSQPQTKSAVVSAATTTMEDEASNNSSSAYSVPQSKPQPAAPVTKPVAQAKPAPVEPEIDNNIAVNNSNSYSSAINNNVSNNSYYDAPKPPQSIRSKYADPIDVDETEIIMDDFADYDDFPEFNDYMGDPDINDGIGMPSKSFTQSFMAINIDDTPDGDYIEGEFDNLMYPSDNDFDDYLIDSDDYGNQIDEGYFEDFSDFADININNNRQDTPILVVPKKTTDKAAQMRGRWL